MFKPILFIFSHIAAFLLFAFLLLLMPHAVSADSFHHDLSIDLHPETAQIRVIDTVTLATDKTDLYFSLHNDFTVTTTNADIALISRSTDKKVNYYQLSRLSAHKKVQIHYHGKIKPVSREDLFGMPDRVFNQQTLYLDGSSHWYPRFAESPLFSFTLEANLPAGWEIISQGKRIRIDDRIRYTMKHPQDDIYLLGGLYKRYTKEISGTELEVFLLKENPSLAASYLDSSAKYLELYNDWIGRYPYAKFAVVENQWQTGYGMPSFTLLGSNVIRLPFILYTSLPHEILHNWWGNGVFVDYSTGNWSEGLTAYMADHFSSQQRGQESEYRRKALERYSNFAAKQRDMALIDFRSRHNEASQAVGYSKAMMVFHMLHKLLGKEDFDARVRQFWRNHQFTRVSFAELIELFLSDSTISPNDFISHWLEREGAPEIALSEAAVKKTGNSYQLNLTVTQQQRGEAYPLKIPVKISLSNGSTAYQFVDLAEKSRDYSFNFDSIPVEIHIDPDYDIFRLLDNSERPASMGRLFGSKQQLLIYPASADDQQVNAWKKLAEAWKRKYRNVVLKADSDIKTLPDDVAIWILGKDNRLLDLYRDRLKSESQQLLADRIEIEDDTFNYEEHAVVLLDNASERQPLGFIGANDAETIAKLARKLPHYNSYGRLAFKVTTAKNILKQHLPVSSSPMKRKL